MPETTDVGGFSRFQRACSIGLGGGFVIIIGRWRDFLVEVDRSDWLALGAQVVTIQFGKEYKPNAMGSTPVTDERSASPLG